MVISFEDLKEFILHQVLVERYKSISQYLKFKKMSELPGPEGDKWREMKQHWDEESKGKMKKLPFKTKKSKKRKTS
jgi:hypothetical protein